MVGPLGNIVQKELKELFRDPRLVLGMVAVPLLIFPILGLAIGSSNEATQEQVASSTTAFSDMDGRDGSGGYSSALRAFLELNNLTCRSVSAADTPSAVREAVDGGSTVLIVVPSDFSENLSSLGQSSVEVFCIFRHYSFTEAAVLGQVSAVLEDFSALVVSERLHQAYPNESVQNLSLPVVARNLSVIKGEARDVDPNLVGQTVMGSSISMPMTLMILIIMAGQLAATSVAMEKEQKTLEVLLTLPVRRINILIGKLSGVIVVSLLAVVSYMVGFQFYFNSLGVGGGSVDLKAVGLSPEPVGIVLLGAALLLAFVSALSLAVLLSVFTKDVRSAQSLMGILYIPVMIPAMVLMFAPVSTLPPDLAGVIYAIPFSYPIIASQALYTQQYLPVMLGIVYQFAFTVAVLGLAARVFSTEKILTARLGRGRAKPD